MKNTFIGNVAAGSESIGFWLEMLDKYSNQLNPDSFRDNVAHSNYQCLLTYKRGWKPKEPAFINNLQTYRDHEGLKFHTTGNIKFTNTVIADKRFGIRYGAWNTCITFEDTYITGRSRDRELRLGKSCPMSNGVGIRASFNSVPGNYGQIALSNVTFSDFGCGVGSLVVTKIHAWGKIWGILFSRPM